MKLKYYMRGLGIGMLVAAMVLALSGNAGAKMSDEAVKRRAAELGMVERDKTVLNDIGGPADEDGQSGNDGAKQAGPEGAEEIKPEADAAKPETGAVKPEAVAAAPEEAGKPEDSGDAREETPAGTPEAEEISEEQEAVQKIQERADEIVDRAEEIADNAPAGRSVTLEVRRGDSSVAVARRAAEAGLVSSAADFDVFLCRNGYDKRISVGSYEIIEGMTEKEIADIITKSR